MTKKLISSLNKSLLISSINTNEYDILDCIERCQPGIHIISGMDAEKLIEVSSCLDSSDDCTIISCEHSQDLHRALIRLVKFNLSSVLLIESCNAKSSVNMLESLSSVTHSDLEKIKTLSVIHPNHTLETYYSNDFKIGTAELLSGFTSQALDEYVNGYLDINDFESIARDETSKALFYALSWAFFSMVKPGFDLGVQEIIEELKISSFNFNSSIEHCLDCCLSGELTFKEALDDMKMLMI